MTNVACRCGGTISDSRNKTCRDCYAIPRDALADEVEFLTGYGEHPERIAERLGRSTAAIARALYRHGRPDLANPFRRASRHPRIEERAA